MTLSRREQNKAKREQQILDAALEVFAANGYTGTTMDEVAATAGITKPTLYQYFASKDALFQAMMSGKRARMIDVFDHPSPEGMVHDLHTFAWAYADTVMRAEMLSIARLIIGEVQRFPELGRAYQASGPDHLLEDMITWLTRHRDAGRLTFADAELAAQDLWGLILSAPRTQALYAPDAPPSRPQIARYLNNGLSVFLRAYSTQAESDLKSLQAAIAAKAGSKAGRGAVGAAKPARPRGKS